MKLPVQLLSHDTFRVILEGHDIWFNPQDHKRTHAGPKTKIKATWCFLTHIERVYIPSLLEWAKDRPNTHFIAGPSAQALLAHAGIPQQHLIEADSHGWAITPRISFKAVGTNHDSPSYLLSTPSGNLLFASPSFAKTDGPTLVKQDSEADLFFCQVACRQKPRPHRIHKHSLRTRALTWLSKAWA
jgi:hypothetical protein